LPLAAVPACDQVGEGPARIPSLAEIGLDDAKGIGEALAWIAGQGALSALGGSEPEKFGNRCVLDRRRPPYLLV